MSPKKSGSKASPIRRQLQLLWSNRGILYLFLVLVLFLVGSVAVGALGPAIVLNENQILYFYSTGAQVVGAFLGLTLAGYAFLVNDLDRQANEDDSLLEVIERIKLRNYQLVFFLVFLGAFSILLCLFVLAIEGTKNWYSQVTSWMNIAGSTTVVEILAIFYFVLEMLEPKKIEKTSDQMKESFVSSLSTPSEEDSQHPENRLAEFMRLFNLLEQHLQLYYNNVHAGQTAFAVASSSPGRRSSPRQVIRSLFSDGVIGSELYSQLSDLIGFRNSLVHGTDLSVSESSVENAKDLVRTVEEILAKMRPKNDN